MLGQNQQFKTSAESIEKKKKKKKKKEGSRGDQKYPLCAEKEGSGPGSETWRTEP